CASKEATRITHYVGFTKDVDQRRTAHGRAFDSALVAYWPGNTRIEAALKANGICERCGGGSLLYFGHRHRLLSGLYFYVSRGWDQCESRHNSHCEPPHVTG